MKSIKLDPSMVLLTDELVRQLESSDPRTGLRAVATLRRLVNRIEELHVRHARAEGLTWLEIGEELGITKQATHQRYAGREGS